jgi:polyisoprenoid-binding protein YceI
MNRRLVYGVIAAAVLVALAGGGVYVYFFSSLRSSPQQLSLGSASPSATASVSAAGLAGTWTVASGSQAGYRVNELFVGQTTKHQAVARTSGVSGGMIMAGDATTGYQISSITITANLTGLHSVDQVAGRDVTQRDFIVSRQMNLQQFPDAQFTASSVSIPGPVSGSKVSSTFSGSLTIHGVTKTVSATVQSQVSGARIEVAGSVTTDMADFGVTPPQIGFTTVDSQVVIDFDIFLTKAS